MTQEKGYHPTATKVSMPPSETPRGEDVLSTQEVENGNVKEREFTEEQNANQLRTNEEDFLQGLIDAAGYVAEERQRIEIARNGRVLFAFSIHPLSESEYSDCKKKHTKYVRNRSLGVKMPEDTDNVKYRADLIYRATIDEDKKKLWDNKKIWETLRDKGMQIVSPLDVIEYSLKAGEKEEVIDRIDRLSGYNDNLEEVTKN
ncbi:MAG: hypothetical protein NC293_07610 [Roseburia sp.]|nr:hypothetical protein [Roseburia sp.]